MLGFEPQALFLLANPTLFFELRLLGGADRCESRLLLPSLIFPLGIALVPSLNDLPMFFGASLAFRARHPLLHLLHQVETGFHGSLSPLGEANVHQSCQSGNLLIVGITTST